MSDTPSDSSGSDSRSHKAGVSTSVSIPEIEDSFGTNDVGVPAQSCKVESVGPPGFWEGFIPIWGSGRAAYDDFQNGRWGWGLFNSALAATDVFLVKALVTGVLKATGKAVLKEGAEAAVRETAEKAFKPQIHMGKQGKHIPGHNNFQLGKSEFTHPDPQGLLDRFTGSGIRHGNKEVVDFGENIGVHVSETGVRTPTTRGTIHYDASGGAHIVPAKPAL